MNRGRAILLVILLVAAVVRFHGLMDQGFFMFDEARYLLEAEEFSAQVSWAARNLGAVLTGEVPPPFAHRDFAEGTARPLHVLLVAACGARPDRALALQAFLGLLLVLAVSTLGGRLTAALAAARDTGSLPEPGARPQAIEKSAATGAVLAALFAALSPALLFWSRTILAEIGAALAFTLFLLALIEPKGRGREYAAGLCAGIAIALQSRLALVVPAVLVLDLLAHRSPARLLRLAIATAAPLLAIQAAHLAIEQVFARAGQADRFETYAEQLRFRAAVDGGAPALNRPLFSLFFLSIVEGPAWTILALSAAALLVAGARRPRVGPGTAVVAGAFLWIIVLAALYDQHRFSGERYGRMLAPAVPIGAALAAALLAHVKARPLLLALAAVVVLVGPSDRASIVGMHSDQAAVLGEAAARAGTATVWSEEPLHVAVHLGPDSFPARFLPRSDTLTVVILDEQYARNFGFVRFLPDTPAFLVPRRGHVAPVLVTLEAANHRDVVPALRAAAPAKVYLLGPDATVVP